MTYGDQALVDSLDADPRSCRGSRNPLADPGVLGIDMGASLAVGAGS